MTLTPLPAQGSTAWYPWATDVHQAVNAATTVEAVRDQVALAKTMRQARRGINVAGAEFSSANVIWENPASFAFLAARGHRLVRLPLLWENIQPTLGGALNSTILGGLKTTIAAAEAAGIKVIVDIHNYAKYNGIAYGDAGSFTQADFVDLWSRLSLVFRDDPTVIGYGLMNEPRLLPTVNSVTGNERWKLAQQAALNGIRDNDDPTCVLISGYTAASLAGWFNATAGQPVPYITDPADNFRWEAHHYWDSNGGKYNLSYAAEATTNAGWGGGDPTLKKTLFELNKWIDWLKQYGQRGYIGEFGWPSSAGPFPADAASWDNIGAQYLTRIDQEGDLIWATAWATGSRWSAGYELQYYTPTAGVLATPLSNAATLEAHRERGVIGIGQSPNRSLTIQPADYTATWVGWSSDPTAIAGATALPSTGALVLTELKLHKDTAVSSLTVCIGTAGAGGTTGQCFAGIYDSAGVLLASSADIATLITTTGYRTFNMATPTGILPAGTVLYGAVLVNATTQPQLARTTSLGAALQTPMIRRYGLSGTGQTALPASFSPGSMAVAPAAFWMAVS